MIFAVLHNFEFLGCLESLAKLSSTPAFLAFGRDPENHGYLWSALVRATQAQHAATGAAGEGQWVVVVRQSRPGCA